VKAARPGAAIWGLMGTRGGGLAVNTARLLGSAGRVRWTFGGRGAVSGRMPAPPRPAFKGCRRQQLGHDGEGRGDGHHTRDRGR